MSDRRQVDRFCVGNGGSGSTMGEALLESGRDIAPRERESAAGAMAWRGAGAIECSKGYDQQYDERCCQLSSFGCNAVSGSVVYHNGQSRERPEGDRPVPGKLAP